MTNTQHMRLSGHSGAFALTPDAHLKILDYLAASRERLRGSPDADETIRDLEAALGDRLAILADPTGQALDESQIAAALEALGDVEPDAAGLQATGETARGPFWCRILEDKWFAGICVGIATRGSFDLGWLRTIMFFLLLLSGGFIGLVYLVVALFLPPVATVAEYRRLAASPAPVRSAGSRSTWFRRR
jgi:phage shock protein PspC (stress-responsive transcriptional regulator)